MSVSGGEVHVPRYDYQCESCKHEFELRQSFSSEPVATCPNCQGVSKRQFHSVPIVFKGSGWYVNDYGKRKQVSGSSAESKDSDGETPKSEAKPESDAKPESESKSESKSKPASEEKTASKTEAKKKDKVESAPTKKDQE